MKHSMTPLGDYLRDPTVTFLVWTESGHSHASVRHLNQLRIPYGTVRLALETESRSFHFTPRHGLVVFNPSRRGVLTQDSIFQKKPLTESLFNGSDTSMIPITPLISRTACRNLENIFDNVENDGLKYW